MTGCALHHDKACQIKAVATPVAAAPSALFSDTNTEPFALLMRRAFA